MTIIITKRTPKKKQNKNNKNRIPQIELPNIPTRQINQNIIKPPPLPPAASIAKSGIGFYNCKGKSMILSYSPIPPLPCHH
jgi:hypothetical protein